MNPAFYSNAKAASVARKALLGCIKRHPTVAL